VAVAIQVISSHPLFIRAVEKTLVHLRTLYAPILSTSLSETEILSLPGPPRFFLLDGCSLRTDLGRLAARCRAQSPGSKFLALLSPGTDSQAEMIRLFYWGIDGFLELHKTWQTELPHAIQSILKGKLWVPPEVLLEYARHARTLLDAQLLPGHSLTAREGQVLQLLMRRLKNREISGALGISERTVKFHVSNILGKLQLDDRRGLSPDKLTVKALAVGA